MSYTAFIRQRLTERTAPLYHAASLFSAGKYLKENRIAGRTVHGSDIDGSPTVDAAGFEHGSRTMTGVSLTRSYEFAASWKPVIFVLDQAALATRYRLVPYSYSYNKMGIERGHHANQFEEFLVGDIDPLDRYTTAIMLSPKLSLYVPHWMADAEHVQAALTAHPKFVAARPALS